MCIMWSKSRRSDFLLHIDIQLLQWHLFQRLSFPRCITFTPLSQLTIYLESSPGLYSIHSFLGCHNTPFYSSTVLNLINPLLMGNYTTYNLFFLFQIMLGKYIALWECLFASYKYIVGLIPREVSFTFW